jgi:hypothetical protein
MDQGMFRPLIQRRGSRFADEISSVQPATLLDQRSTAMKRISSRLLSISTALALPAFGQIPEGTSPIDPADVVSEITYDFGDRLITAQEVTANVIPTPPKAVRPSAVVAPHGETHSAISNHEFIGMGVTVYFSNSAPTRSLITFTPKGGVPLNIWSSADWRLLQPIASLVGNGGKDWGILMMPTFLNLDNARALATSVGFDFEEPVIPLITGSTASFVVTQGSATPQQLEPIQLLHNHYNENYSALLADYHERETARLQREAELLANPPVPKNITMRMRELTSAEIEATKPDAAE